MNLYHVLYKLEGGCVQSCVTFGVDERAAMCRIQATHPLHNVVKLKCSLVESGVCYS